MQNKTKAITGGVAAAALVGSLGAYSILSNGTTNIELDYTLNQSDYRATMTIDMPDTFTADIAELKLNGEKVTKCLLPNGELTSIPLVYSDLDNLSITFYKLNEEIGEGTFEEGKIKATVASGSIKEEAK